LAIPIVISPTAEFSGDFSAFFKRKHLNRRLDFINRAHAQGIYPERNCWQRRVFVMGANQPLSAPYPSLPIINCRCFTLIWDAPCREASASPMHTNTEKWTKLILVRSDGFFSRVFWGGKQPQPFLWP
jgi:hypothetical protein